MEAEYQKARRAFAKFKLHANEITEEFLKCDLTSDWARAYRELSGISLRDMELLTGFSKSAIGEIEKGTENPVYYSILIELWSMRNDVEFTTNWYSTIISNSRDLSTLTLDDIASTHNRLEWRACPMCGRIKLFTHKQTIYCSYKCLMQANQAGIRVRYSATKNRPKAFKCPHCGTIISNYRKFLMRDLTDESYRQTPAESLRQMVATPGRREVQEVLRRLEGVLLTEADAEVQQGTESHPERDLFQELLKQYYDAHKEA